jgi:hypothetical protein
MMNDDVDRILGGESDVQPSGRFAQNVMAAVRREAAIPPPIEFPWRRALPGMVAAGVALLALIGLSAAAVMSMDVSLPQPGAGRAHAWLGLFAWSALGCLVSWAAVRASATLSERR